MYIQTSKIPKRRTTKYQIFVGESASQLNTPFSWSEWGQAVVTSYDPGITIRFWDFVPGFALFLILGACRLWRSMYTIRSTLWPGKQPRRGADMYDRSLGWWDRASLRCVVVTLFLDLFIYKTSHLFYLATRFATFSLSLIFNLDHIYRLIYLHWMRCGISSYKYIPYALGLFLVSSYAKVKVYIKLYKFTSFWYYIIFFFKKKNKL